MLVVVIVVHVDIVVVVFIVFVIVKYLYFSVDPVTIPSKMGKGVLKRVSEVFDCWFESGSMPYAQQHYPFEHKREFEDRLVQSAPDKHWCLVAAVVTVVYLAMFDA